MMSQTTYLIKIILINKLIKLRIIIIHFSESNPKNFEKSNPKHLQIINELVLELNNRFSTLSTTSEQVCNYESSPNCTFSGSINNENDTKIQFSLNTDDIHEVIDPYHWNGDNFNICGDILNSLNQNIQIGGNDAMNIFLVGSDCKHKEKVLLESQPNCSPPTWITNGHACANFPNANMNFRSASVYRFFEKYKAMQNRFYCDDHPTCCPLECPTSWWFCKLPKN